MVEAVVANSYQGVSVRQVVGLAGVSRRSFYEQFANKQECFLATFDSIAARGVKRIRRAYLASEGPLEDRLATAFEELSEEVGTNWKDARLVVVEAQTAGPAGLERLRRITATCEQMLFSSFALAPEASPMPMPVVRGIIGGLHANMSVCLREGNVEQLRAMTEEMRRWTLLFQTPAAERMAARLTEPMRGGPPRGHSPNGWDRSDHDDRERLLHNALRLALINDYEKLSAPQIAEEASVPMDRFFEMFADKNECFLAALDELGDEFLQVAADPALAGEDWPRAARRAIGELMRYLAERPLYAQTIAAGAFAAGPDAASRIREIGHDLATLLVQGAPERAQSDFALEGVVGAIGHTIRCQVASEQFQLLPALSDHLAYVVLAPFIGADAAAEIVIEDRPEPAPA
jgi:AcrR family transcriptional regulator